MLRLDMYLDKVYTQVNLRYNSRDDIGYPPDPGPEVGKINSFKYKEKELTKIGGEFLRNQLKERWEYVVVQNIYSQLQFRKLDAFLQKIGYTRVKKTLNKVILILFLVLQIPK
jgi:hypothetical protein